MTNPIALDTRLHQLADDLNHALIEQMVSRGDLTSPVWRSRLCFGSCPRPGSPCRRTWVATATTPGLPRTAPSTCAPCIKTRLC